MIKVIINGCNGHMGQVLSDEIKKDPELTVVVGIDRNPHGKKNIFPVLKDLSKFDKEADVVIDFSHPSSLSSLLNYSTKHHVPLIIATTGLNIEEVEMIKEASKITKIFYTANMSLGINVLLSLVSKTASILGDSFDIEIIEKHHNKKIDAPSGTAFMIANSMNEELNNSRSFTFGRHTNKNKRNNKEIGIHAVRGGTIVGEHHIIFAGKDEIIEISHKAASKSIFAAGAIKAAKFLLSKDNGLYGMTDLLD